MFGLQGWVITALSLRRNSTEHNLLLYQVGPQSGSNTGLGCLSGAHKEPASTFSMPDTNFHIETDNTFIVPADTIRPSGPHTPPSSGSRACLYLYLCLCLCPYAGLTPSFLRPLTCSWPGIIFSSTSHDSSPRVTLSRRAESPGV